MGLRVKGFAKIALVVLFAIPAHADSGAVLSGVAGVKDGDGILFCDVEVRLQGIAAPEYRRGQTEAGGREALRALEALAKGKVVRCVLDGTTARRRPVGICYFDGQDLGAAMLEAGFARDCPRYSKGR